MDSYERLLEFGLKPYGQLSDKQILELESKIQFKMPLDYRQFMQLSNGGNFPKTYVGCMNLCGEDILINPFLSYEIEDKVLEIVHWYNMFGAEYKGVNAAQIALSDPGIIVLVWENGSKDGVYLWDDGLELETSTEDDCMYKIANSFDEFVGKLYLWDPED